VGRRVAGGALLSLALAALPAEAVEPREFMRPCRHQDLLGVWRLLRLGVAGGSQVDRTDPAFLPHQRYVFHSNATMAHASQEVPFTAEAQRGLTKLPPSATWTIESEGRLVRQRDGIATVEAADCRVLTHAIKDPKTSQPTAQAGDVLLTDEGGDRHPPSRRLLRKIRGLDSGG
jgi:hypothetical protein